MGLFGSKKEATPSLALGIQLANGSATATALANKSPPMMQTSFDSGYTGRVSSNGSVTYYDPRSVSPFPSERSSGYATGNEGSKKKEKRKDKKARSLQAQQMEAEMAKERAKASHTYAPRLELPLADGNVNIGSSGMESQQNSSLRVQTKQDIARFSINGMLALVDRRMEETDQLQYKDTLPQRERSQEQVNHGFHGEPGNILKLSPLVVDPSSDYLTFSIRIQKTPLACNHLVVHLKQAM